MSKVCRMALYCQSCLSELFKNDYLLDLQVYYPQTQASSGKAAFQMHVLPS